MSLGPVTELLGRAAELERVVAAVRRRPPIVQIVGCPGAGASTLAAAVAHALGLSRVLRFDGIRASEGIARVLGEADAGRTFDDLLRTGDGAVWVLDGCSGVLSMLRATLASFAGASATLVVAGGARLPYGEVVALGPLEGDPAMRLYQATTRRLRGESDGDPDRVVQAVLSRLDGLPGAIVAAAERAELLGGKRLAERLATDPSTLTGTELHASMARAFAELPEQTALALLALSVLDKSFSSDTAEAVVGTPSALAEVHALLCAGLIGATTTTNGARRLALVRPLRDWLRHTWSTDRTGAREGALARLASHVAQATGSKCAGETIDPADSLRALDALVAAGDLDGASRVVGFVDLRSPAALATDAGVRALDSVVAALDEGPLTAPTSMALIARARAHQTRGHLARAEEDVTRARSLAKRSADVRARGLADQRLASIRTDGGDTRAGKRLAEKAFEVLTGTSPRDAAAALSTLGTAEMALGETTAARAHFVAALALREQAHDDEGAGQEHAGIGATLYQEGRLGEAVRAYDRAKELLEASPRGDLFGYVLAARALALQELGHYADAEHDLSRATDVWLAHQSLRFFRVFLGYLAQLRHEAGHLDEAERTYREAIAELRDARHLVYAELFRASLGALLAEAGRSAEAEALFGDPEGGALGPTAIARRVHRGHLCMHDARTAKSVGAPFDHHVARAKEALGLARAAHTDDDVRFAERMLARAITAFGSGDSGQNELTIGKDTSSFRVGPRAPVDLRRKRATRLMLAALVQARAERPGEPLPVDALVAATWPGERILPQAALSRVYVTVLMLRNLGLRTVLVQRDGGYMLHPDVRLVQET